MRDLRLISTTAAILLLGAGAVSAQSTKTDQTATPPAAQQSAPAEKMAPASKSDQIKTPETTGHAAPMASASDNKQQKMDKGAPASLAAKDSTGADGGTSVKSKRAERHVGAQYARGYRGPIYDSYRGDRGYRDCRHHSWMPWLWC